MTCTASEPDGPYALTGLCSAESLGLQCVPDFSVFGGLGWVGSITAKVLKI